MDDWQEGLEKFKRQLDATKFRLSQLDILCESVKHSQCKGLAGPKANSVLSSLCTKWMQWNAGLERLDDICVADKTDNDTQTMATATANKFILYSILDEFKFNDSTMPNVTAAPLNGGDTIARERGYIGTGYISHIENESIGMVYIVDACRAPESNLLFGDKPQPLNHLPEPGEMFGLAWNEKYLVRAVRVEYESGADVMQKRQYSAWLMDIGCTVRVDIQPTLRDHYEVSEAAKTIPAYAKRFQLVQIPDRTTVYDLLHVRIQYEVILVENDLGFVNVRRAGANPFAVGRQNEWNFFMYYFGNNVSAFSSRRVKKQSQPTSEMGAAATTPALAQRSQPTDCSKNTNPFLGGAYEIESIPMKPQKITKGNPFYSESMENLYETSQAKQKFVNFKLNKLLNIQAALDLPTHRADHRNDSHQTSNNNGHQPFVETKILNGSAHSSNGVNEKQIHLNRLAQSKPAAETRADVQRQKHESVEKPSGNGDLLQPPPKPHQPEQQQSPVTDVNSNNISSVPMKQNVAEKKPLEMPAPVKLTMRNGFSKDHSSTTSSSGFPQPKNLPRVGDKIKVLFQVLESVEVFYGTMVDDPERDMAVHEFSMMLNAVKERIHFKQYGTVCDCFSAPKLYDKVLAKYTDDCFYRAQVIGVIDDHTFQVFYVDYGNCEIVQTTELFKYDSKWDKYPAYALRFRLNGIEEIHPWDYEARNALEQLLNGDCDAHIVRIQYCDKTKRTTYVVDMYDENQLSVADSMVLKNMAIYEGAMPKKHVKRPQN